MQSQIHPKVSDLKKEIGRTFSKIILLQWYQVMDWDRNVFTRAYSKCITGRGFLFQDYFHYCYFASKLSTVKASGSD